jgi:hypothetical protein
MARLQTEVESFLLVGGERQARSWSSRVVEPAPTSPQAIAKGNLYVQLELGGEVAASPRLYRLLLNTIQGVYYDAAGGITGGITQAILAGHQAILEHNRVHPEEAQLGGVSCVVLRGEELYVGIGGPAMVLIGLPGQVEQFPSEISETVTPLGTPEAPAVELFRTNLQGEAMVIQVQSEWVARIPARKLAAVALAHEIRTAQDYLESLAPEDAAMGALFLRTRPAAAPSGAAAAVGPDEAVDGDEVTEPGPEAEAIAPTQEEIREPSEAPAEAPSDVVSATSLQVVPQPQDMEPARRRWPWLLVLLLPLLLIVVVSIGYYVQQRNLQREFDTLMQGGLAALEAARVQDIPADTARQQLSDAQERVDSALALKPGNEEALALGEQIQQTLDEINNIVPLYKLITLQPLGGADSDPGRVIVQGNRIYVLDQGSDQVLRFGFDPVSGLVTEGSSAVIAQRGQPLPDGQVVGELIDMTWAAAGGARQSSALLILDSNNNVLEVDDALGLRPLLVAGRDQWQAPRLISSYIGNLYVLDSGSGRILRYVPGSEGYNNPPESYFEGDATLDLSRVVSMAIDGNIWILYGDGTVQKFFGGRQEPLELQVPPNGPVAQPQALQAGSEAGAAQDLYIADSSQGRILAYDKDGNYLRQYRPADQGEQDKLRQMRDLQVEEIDRVFYILTTDGLYQTNIP